MHSSGSRGVELLPLPLPCSPSFVQYPARIAGVAIQGVPRKGPPWTTCNTTQPIFFSDLPSYTKFLQPIHAFFLRHPPGWALSFSSFHPFGFPPLDSSRETFFPPSFDISSPSFGHPPRLLDPDSRSLPSLCTLLEFQLHFMTLPPSPFTYIGSFPLLRVLPLYLT